MLILSFKLKTNDQIDENGMDIEDVKRQDHHVDKSMKSEQDMVEWIAVETARIVEEMVELGELVLKQKQHPDKKEATLFAKGEVLNNRSLEQQVIPIFFIFFFNINSLSFLYFIFSFYIVLSSVNLSSLQLFGTFLLTFSDKIASLYSRRTIVNLAATCSSFHKLLVPVVSLIPPLSTCFFLLFYYFYFYFYSF